MPLSPLAGKPAPADLLIDVPALVAAYHDRKPDLADARQLVSFGTSGHRGTSLDGTFTEPHILAITQAIAEHRRARGIDGPLYMGCDTHALSAPAQQTALEVLAGNGVETVIARGGGVTPTPVVSWSILTHNRGEAAGWPTASSSRRRTTRRPTAGSSTTRPMVGRPTPTSPAGRPGSGQRACSASGLRNKCGVKRVVAGRHRSTHAQDLIHAVRERPDRPWSTWTAIAQRQTLRSASIRSAGASLPYWQADRREIQARSNGG